MAQRSIAIIGGGAAGLMAALTASRLGAKVIILEKNDRIGKKILATGNGRCNFTNVDLDLKYYHGQNPLFAKTALDCLTGPRTIELFRELGIEPRQEEAGKIFPASGQASSVLDVLRYELDQRKVPTICKTAVTSIARRGSIFDIQSTSGSFTSKAVILATGGKAGPQFGCSGDGYTLAASMGHRLVSPFPALVQLRLDAPFLNAISGVKFFGETTLYDDHQPMDCTVGDVLFTKYGISGPTILSLSRMAGELMAKGKKPYLGVSLCPKRSTDQINQYLRERFARQKGKSAEFCLVGFIHKRLIRVLLKEAQIDPTKPSVDVRPVKIAALARHLTNWRFVVTGTNGWTSAQVTAGGLDTIDIDPQTLSSRKVPRLFFAGETIDIDGDCGGYNLQWAWSSGFLAATAACKTMP